MPHDVTMPQLGMAQDAGRLVAWLKAPGAAVARGDALFEVETDKATMEVEAQAGGYLTGITAKEGDDVPVGAVIARITETAEAEAGDEAAEATPEAAPDATPEAADLPANLPGGRTVTMPQLGMAQDSGVLVGWLKAPGDAVAADDLLFEVETDKSTMEVEAGHAGYLAATLAAPGEEVAVGGAVAIIAAERPATPVARSVKDAGKAAGKAGATPAATATPAQALSGRILASPKARRLAREQGLDLARLAAAGHPQPFHAADLEVLRALPAEAGAEPGAGPGAAMAPAARRLVAEVAAPGLAAFTAWAAEAKGLGADAVLAGLAAAALPRPGPETVMVAVERHGRVTTWAAPPSRALSDVTGTDADTEAAPAPALLLRDLRGSGLSAVETGAEAVPVITLTGTDDGLALTLECRPDALDAGAAIALLAAFAGRVRDPLRHLL